MDTKQRIIVKAEPGRNQLTITFAGDIVAGDMKPYEASVEAALQGIQPGFLLFSDFTSLQSMEVACMPYIQKAMERCRDHGIKRVVRVIPDPRKDIGFNIMSLFHLPRGLPILTCKTHAEAERALK